jgi:hypothetical protein
MDLKPWYSKTAVLVATIAFMVKVNSRVPSTTGPSFGRKYYYLSPLRSSPETNNRIAQTNIRNIQVDIEKNDKIPITGKMGRNIIRIIPSGRATCSDGVKKITKAEIKNIDTERNKIPNIVFLCGMALRCFGRRK